MSDKLPKSDIEPNKQLQLVVTEFKNALINVEILWGKVRALEMRVSTIEQRTIRQEARISVALRKASRNYVKEAEMDAEKPLNTLDPIQQAEEQARNASIIRT